MGGVMWLIGWTRFQLLDEKMMKTTQLINVTILLSDGKDAITLKLEISNFFAEHDANY